MEILLPDHALIIDSLSYNGLSKNCLSQILTLLNIEKFKLHLLITQRKGKCSINLPSTTRLRNTLVQFHY